MHRGDRSRRACAGPQSGSRIGLARGGDRVEQVGRLAVIRPGEAQVQGQTAADLPVITGVQESVILAEIQVRIAVRKLHPIRRVIRKGVPTTETEGAVKERQKDIGRTLIGPVDTGLQRVLAHRVVPVVLDLPCVHDAALGQVGCGPDRQERNARLIKGDAGDRLVNPVRRRHGVQAVAAKVHVQAVEACAQFIDHFGTEVVGIADQYRLA